ncbi:hypothetical protein A9Q99_07640 [Gammaproteobacteria bacterium 45_16_T64]|nr:hypothetical protein A9Q99_07640 [Gammaproteobacteria bacterium 45_16_T64]
MFIKLITLIVLILVVVTLVKRGKNKNSVADKSTPPAVVDESMKRCAQCGVHLPVAEAQTYQTLHFCCNEHKRSYLEDQDH